jgi:uncharacterized protein YjiS (DUF1127 family)
MLRARFLPHFHKVVVIGSYAMAARDPCENVDCAAPLTSLFAAGAQQDAAHAVDETAPNLKPTTVRIEPMAVTTNRPLGAGFRAYGVLAAIVGRIAAWNDARVTRKALSKLTDRELDDLGLTRGDIEDIAVGRY